MKHRPAQTDAQTRSITGTIIFMVLCAGRCRGTVGGKVPAVIYKISGGMGRFHILVGLDCNADWSKQTIRHQQNYHLTSQANT